MKAKTNQELLRDMSPFISNPMRSISLGFAILEDLTEGTVRMVEASNPVAYDAEIMATQAAAVLDQAEVFSRRMYPELARTEEDLYLHMADVDYLNRFSTPATMVIGAVFNEAELKGIAVPIHDGSGASKLVIPKHSFFTLAGSEFVTQYPIEIKILHNGSFSISMDYSSTSPLYLPPSNMVSFEVSQIDNDRFIIINIPVQQVSVSSHLLQLTSFSGFSQEFRFSDNFHYIRAFIYNQNTRTWVEAATTHNPIIYDPNKPTVLLQVRNQTVAATIPQIYFDTGLVRDSVRLDIYTTKGELNIDYSDYDVGTFKLKFQDLDRINGDVYSAPFGQLVNLAVIPRTPLKGGRGPMTFNQMQRRFIRRSAVVAGLPITSNQLSQDVSDTNFELITQLDDITNRQFILTRDVDPPEDKSSATGLPCTMGIAHVNMNELAVYNGVMIDGGRVTLKTDTLLEGTTKGLRLVPKKEVNDLKLMATRSPDALANIVNGREFYFSPYIYVMDDSSDQFNMRPYHMSSPDILSRVQFQLNDSVGLAIRSEEYVIVPNNDGTGYIMMMTLEKSEALGLLDPDQLKIQLSYRTGTGGRRTYIAGSLISKLDPKTGRPVSEEWIYRFEWLTDYDIDNQHRLNITNTGFPVDLTQEVDVIFIVKDYRPPEAFKGDIDTIISVNHIENYDWRSFYIGQSQEKITIQFGHFLKHLWRRSRTIEEVIEFQTYPEDVLARYPTDIYKRKADGSLFLEIDRETNTSKLVKLHNRGDIIKVDGENQVKYPKGSIVYRDGKPVPKKTTRDLIRQVDLFLVDGRHYFVNHQPTMDYLDRSINTITNWVVTDVPDIEQRGIDETEFFFHPKQGVGNIEVMIEDGSLVTAKSNQSLRVTYKIRKEKYEDPEVVANLKETTAKTITDAINSIKRVSGTAISRGDIESVLKAIYRGDIIDVNISGWMNDEHDMILISDLSAVPTVGKKLTVLSNMALTIEDDVAIDFKPVDNTHQALGRYNFKRK